ncbi:hypothetical protein [Halalkalibacter hemicellulosilyticus]|uniref:Uncharacterized protein n=1 Tax=Halalkalibacter hemicellulosilyticusJCM 9152 TaxID=1236971 RepID=W4QGH3_9BACI|nr:hypothetical protein [Halalkalibacter hemicellulosilyticus]GAE31215.1 hypothetical protein JCM9152_2670 [Halalkalibacter hemicellulosilyticusJCM 9152]
MKVFIGIIIFALVTMISFYVLSTLVQLHEGASVIIALIVGLAVEVFVRRKWR